jgi:hypothetical protein
MPDDYCAPFDQCTDFDGRLLIDRTIYGPPLAREEDELPFGALTLRGAELRPSIGALFLQQWKVREACQAPIRTVMGLAPGETITVDVARTEQTDYTTLFQQACDWSSVDTQTTRDATEDVHVLQSGGQDGVVGLVPWIINKIGLGPIGSFTGGLANSFLPPGVTGGTGGLPLPGGFPLPGGTGDLPLPEASPDSFTDLMSTMIQVLFGSGQNSPVVQDTTTTVHEALHTIETMQSHHTLTERSFSDTRTLEQRITRTFANPYADRSLELRFIPVFRRFEVVTTIMRVQAGLALLTGQANFPRTGLVEQFGPFLQEALKDPQLLNAATAELAVPPEAVTQTRSTALHDHLMANADIYTRRFLAHAHRSGDRTTLAAPMFAMLARHGGPPSATTASTSSAEPPTAVLATGVAALPAPVRFSYGFDWSKMRVRDNAISVPLAPLDTLKYYWPLSAERGQRMSTAVAAIAPNAVGALMPQPVVRQVKLFIGTHVEAVPGACVLHTLPPPAQH